MAEPKKYYSLVTAGRTANITIYGDITSWPWMESDVSSYQLSKLIDGLDVDEVNVYINSYGGEVAEGLAIYNALKRHKAKIKTYADGFVCSAATLPFAAGDERIMSVASLLMVHNAWTSGRGNASELRKLADDLETITQASINAYMQIAQISEDDVKKLMDAETWITPGDAVLYGFATSIANDSTPEHPAQSARTAVAKLMYSAAKKQQADPPASPSAEPPAEPPPVNRTFLKLESLIKA